MFSRLIQEARCAMFDRIPGGDAGKHCPCDFDPKELEAGIRDEMEHTTDRRIATEIAIDHLSKDKNYYKKLRKAHID